jgi:indolepyruvate ferredoxin oxidoreductase alpha subunit
MLMENGTTAMTGHQDHAASGKNFNEVTDTIPIRQVLKGLGVKHIYETDTYLQEKLTQMVKEAVAVNEFSVVIAKHPCMLKLTREKRKQPGYERHKVLIDQEKCRHIHECIEIFGCPTFTKKSDGSIGINSDLCIGDGSCIQTCPAKAIGQEEKNR